MLQQQKLPHGTRQMRAGKHMIQFAARTWQLTRSEAAATQDYSLWVRHMVVQHPAHRPDVQALVRVVHVARVARQLRQLLQVLQAAAVLHRDDVVAAVILLEGAAEECDHCNVCASRQA